MHTCTQIRVVETLSKSGQRQVCRGYCSQCGKPVIAKIVDRKAAKEDQTRCRHEFAILSLVDLPEIVKTHGLEEAPDSLILLLEDIGGASLDRQSPGTPLPLGPFLDLAIGLAGALDGLHHLRILHTSIQPAHIVRNPDNGAFRLIGFSSAVELPHLLATREPPATLEGTLEYISPEQTGRMNRLVDYRTDFYSLGVTFYQLLTGRLPYLTQDALALVHCHIAGVPVPPHELDSAIPETLSRIVLKLMAKMAEDRYQSAAGLRADLERCQRALRQDADIPPFELGLKDNPGRLRTPAMLYGRDTEAARLGEALERICGGGRELLLVTGHGGVGKTTLVHEIQKPVLEKKGYFIEGKFDPMQRNVPYFGWIQALASFVNHLLQANEADLAHWKRSILEAVGNIGAVLTEVIPNLELVIGPQPSAPVLGPVEARNRFEHVFVEFIQSIAPREHPLVVFLDDIQWIDAASLKLLQATVSSRVDASLLLIGSYRDSEVGAAHPLAAALEQLSGERARIERMSLDDLSEQTVNGLIAEALDCDPERSAPLTAIFYAKTGGNPFFVLQTLGSLVARQALTFEAEERRWHWETAALETIEIPDNVITLMLGKIRQLPPDTQHLLSLAACIGFRFDEFNLRVVAGQSEEGVQRALWPALEEGLIVATAGNFQFIHDRVREAAHATIPPEQEPALHLQIGRHLLAHTSESALNDNIYDIVSHCNAGKDLIAEPAERRRLSELNLMAGRRAKSSAAFALAAGHFAAGTALLSPDAWEADYDLATALLLENAEGEYLTGNFDTSEELLDQAVERVRGLLDRARVYRLRQRLYQLSGRFNEALKVALDAFRLLGLSFPNADEEIEAATATEIAKVRENLGGRPIADLADLPLAEDTEAQALIGLLAEALPMVYAVRPLLWPLMTAKAVNLGLERGYTDESPFVYSCYAMVAVAVCREIPAAIQFSETALKLCDRLPGAAAWRGKLLFHHAGVICIWGHHLAANLPLLEQAFRVCLDGGDLVCAGYITYIAIWLQLEKGAPLDQVVELARRYIEFARQNHNFVVYHVDRIEEQFALCLAGETRSSTDFSNAGFDEAECMAAIAQSGFNLGTAYHHIMKLIAAFHAGELEEALQWAERAKPILLQVSCAVNEATYHFYHALTLTALYGQVTTERQREFSETLQDTLGKLKYWQENCPVNFANRYALVQAEIARIENRGQDAMALYERAIASANENSFVQNEALACELAAAFYQLQGYEKIARAYLTEASGCYARWGAFGKLRRLERQHPWLTRTRLADAGSLAERLDAISIAKAQRAISGEILMDRLARTLLEIVMENAGAQLGSLILEDSGELRAVMQHGEDGASQFVFDASPPGGSTPGTILNYVRRTRVTVGLADACSEGGEFAADEYLQRTRPKSVLCVPIQRKEALLGILYLENNLVTGAFTPERRIVLETLASQAAISLENAIVYQALRESEERLRRLNRELHAISNCNQVLVRATDEQQLLSEICRIVCEEAGYRMAWVGYAEQDEAKTVRPVAWAGAEEGYLAKARITWADTERGRGVAGIAVRTGKSSCFQDFRVDPNAAPWREEALLRDYRSSIALPLLNEDTSVFGALTIYSSESNAFIAEEIRLLEELAGDLAFGITVLRGRSERKRAEDVIRKLNAELERRVQQRTAQLEDANKEMESFSYSVSHDLRAPLRHIHGFSGILCTEYADQMNSDARNCVEKIQQSATRMGQMVDDLLNLSRCGRGGLKLTPTDLTQLVEETRAMLKPDWEGRAIEWKIGPLPTLNCDRTLMLNVFQNLLSNAIKFTRQRTPAVIEAGVTEIDGRTAVFVRDNGAGFDMKYVAKLFGVFQRLHRAEEFEGTGVGLATVRRIIRKHGGDIWAYAELDKGATFYFTMEGISATAAEEKLEEAARIQTES